MERVGVVVPAHNPRPSHLERALDSVRGQTLSEWDCVVVDDGSEPRQDLSPPWSTDRRIRVIRQSNSGVAAARNAGAAALDCHYLAFLDQDDEWLPEKLDHQISFMRQHELDMSDTEFSFVDRNGVCVPGFEAHEGDLSRLLTTARMGLSTLIVRRDVYEAVGGFDESLRVATDWDLQLRIAAGGLRFGRLPEMGCLIHLHSHNASADYRLMYREQVAILRRFGRKSDPAIRNAVARGLRHMRDLHAYQAIDVFRRTRRPSDLAWAACRNPRIVGRAVSRQLRRAR